MRAVLAALVVTAVVVVLLVSYDTRPPRRPTRSRRCAPRRRARATPARGRTRPARVTAKGPLVDDARSPRSRSRPRCSAGADRRQDAVADRQRHPHAGAQRARRADPARGGAEGGQRRHRHRHAARPTRARAGATRWRRRSRRRALTERRVEHVMGMPVVVDVRDGDAGPAAFDRVFEWLRFVDATFSTYRADSEIRRLDRGELALRDAHPPCARCSRAASGCAWRPAATSTPARAGRSTPRASSRAGRSTARRRCCRRRARAASASTPAATCSCAAGPGGSASSIRSGGTASPRSCR